MLKKHDAEGEKGREGEDLLGFWGSDCFEEFCIAIEKCEEINYTYLES